MEMSNANALSRKVINWMNWIETNPYQRIDNKREERTFHGDHGNANTFV